MYINFISCRLTLHTSAQVLYLLGFFFGFFWCLLEINFLPSHCWAAKQLSPFCLCQFNLVSSVSGWRGKYRVQGKQKSCWTFIAKFMWIIGRLTSFSIFKLKLVNPTQYRFEHLATQMKWRLQEGGGEAVYQIGVEDNGMLVGLSEEEMRASLKTLHLLAQK